MIWLTWKQHRKQALFAGIGLAALAAIMIPTGLRMHDAFDNSGLGACLSNLGTDVLAANKAVDRCNALSTQFQNEFKDLSFVGILFVILPLLVGLFLGAPLISREVEHGTHRFVWTQGVSRLRWALVKFGLVGVVTALLAVVYALGVSWWYEPLAANGNGRFGYLWFDVQGIAPIGYTLFAVSLGIFAGTFARRVLPAMAVTLAGFAVVRIAVETLGRSHYMPAKTLNYGLASSQGPNPASSDWILSQGLRDGAGKLVRENAQVGCPPSNELKGDASSCLDQMAHQGLGPGSHNWQLYQPGDRFWAFQSIETGIFLALAALLVFLAVRRIRHIA
ncbi:MULTISPECIES: ABC transporter permease [Streptomyces]|uniref:ABC transporter permease n=1 Tax=Streptomyces TaxID=1883 RepID=UPI001D0BDD02|nr:MULTISPECIES: ABC transporter permease subunit [Streptomyces]MCX5084568.1 ABC transporter permease [Streptomyces sp. NBC_00401]UDM04126.1 ABC transporter permease [Streptomyces longhuiensis]